MSHLPPFFAADGDRFVPSASARGPWSARHQHGGPPAALLARAFARLAGAEAQIVRLTFDFLRPVPLAPLTIATRVVRTGAKVQRLAGTVLAEDGTAVIEATCLVMRVTPDSVAVPLETLAPPAPPAESAPFELPFMSGDEGYHRAVEWRLAKGTWGRGPVAAWLRLRVPLVAGETPTPPLECLVAAADSASGVAVALDPASAAAAGADLSALLWVKCAGRLRAALSAADLLARCPGFSLVVLDLDELGPVPASAQIRLQRAVEGSDTILIVRSARHREGSGASLVVATRRLAPRWMGLRPLTRLAGLRSEASIARSHPSSLTLSPLGRGQGEGQTWTIDWTL